MIRPIIKYITFSVLLITSITSIAKVQVRVVDVGSGLCILSSDKVNNKYFLYDAGRWDNDICSDFVLETIESHRLSLIVISHPDSDHLSNLPQILERAEADIIVHTGYKRSRIGYWRKSNTAISKASKSGSTVINLATFKLSNINDSIQLGDMYIEFIYGKASWGGQRGLAENERRNAISIVVKLTAHGQSILFSGDTVGRHEDDPEDVCAYAEQEMINSNKNLEAKILIAPHHGANNASSKCFLDAVKPTSIIFSAGHRYQHPREQTIDRIKNTLGLSDEDMYRTDRGDDEGRKEWDYLRINGCKDKAGDDDIQITIEDNSDMSINYITSENECISSI